MTLTRNFDFSTDHDKDVISIKLIISFISYQRNFLLYLNFEFYLELMQVDSVCKQEKLIDLNHPLGF